MDTEKITEKAVKMQEKINAGFEEEDTLTDRYLTFYIGDEVYAIEIKNVIEIIGIQNITHVPNTKEHIKGIINLRGIIIPVIEVRTRFEIDLIDYSDRTCIIVVKPDNNTVGLIVDQVSEVINIPENQIAPPPQTRKGTKSQFIKGIGKVAEDVKVMLDLHKLLYDKTESEVETEEEAE